MLAMAGITGRPGTEDDQSEGGPPDRRGELHRSLLGQQGVRSSVVRLAPMVHSDLDHHGFTHALIGFAQESGGPRPTPATAPTSGRRPTPTTSVCSTTLALEKAPGGSTLHGVGDTGIPRKVIAETHQPASSESRPRASPAEEAPQYLGFLAAFAGLDNPTSNDRTRELLGWEDDPSGLGRGRGDGPLLRLTKTPASAAGPTDQQHRNPFVTRLWTGIFGSWSSWSRPRPFRSLASRRSAWCSTSSWLP